MAKAGFSAIAVATILAVVQPGWAAPTNPTLMATPPQPKWKDLTVVQKIVLAPLSDDWDAMEYYRQKKWLSIAANFPKMAADEQRRVQTQMQIWVKLTPEERVVAREKYRIASQLPSEKKQELKQKWEEYSSLPDSEKEKLKQLAESQAAARSARPPISAPAPTSPSAQQTSTPAPASAPAPAEAAAAPEPAQKP